MSYKNNLKRTERGPSRFLFFEEIEEVIGTKPSTSCMCLGLKYSIFRRK